MFYPLERLMNLYDGYQSAFSVAGRSLLLVQDSGRCQLLLNQCPHQQAPLTKASLEGGMLRCPVHGMRFDLLTGKSPEGCGQKLQFLPIVYEGNQLGVDL
jgi:nitrite reductase/ring-hydroxylating ferredoxin subunit